MNEWMNERNESIHNKNPLSFQFTLHRTLALSSPPFNSIQFSRHFLSTEPNDMSTGGTTVKSLVQTNQIQLF